MSHKSSQHAISDSEICTSCTQGNTVYIVAQGMICQQSLDIGSRTQVIKRLISFVLMRVKAINTRPPYPNS